MPGCSRVCLGLARVPSSFTVILVACSRQSLKGERQPTASTLGREKWPFFTPSRDEFMVGSVRSSMPRRGGDSHSESSAHTWRNRTCTFRRVASLM